MTSKTTVAEVRARAVAQDPAGDEALLVSFVDACFDDALVDTVSARASDALFAAVREQFEMVCRPRRRGEIHVAVRPLAIPAEHGDTALLTVADDMPFLVDTVSMAARDIGADIDWTLHPVLRVERNEVGEVTAIQGAADQSDHGDEESLIRLEFAAPKGLDGDALAARMHRSLSDLSLIVADWMPMRRQLQQIVRDLDAVPSRVDADECAETQAFLRWLADDHFTLLGYRCREIVTEDGEDAMIDVADTGLGLLREHLANIDPDGYVAPAAALDKWTQSSRILVVAKANTRSWIHHADTMDVIAIKRLDETGHVIGAHRFIGLFSGEAYAVSPRQIPLLRQKVREVLTRATLRPRSHTAKSLSYILETFPRDELFQSSEDELYASAMGMLGMRETERLRLFLRRDRYERFYACMIYMPRERYTVELRSRIETELARTLGGQVQESNAQFLRGALVRIHAQITIDDVSAPAPDATAVEADLIAATLAWPDRFAAAAREVGMLMPAYANAFDASYRERFDAQTAVGDAGVLAELDADALPVLHVTGITQDGDVALKLYGSGDETTLSTVLPMLEDFGLSVHTQRPYVIDCAGRPPQWIHEYEAEHPQAATLVEHDYARGRSIAAAFGDILAGRAEDDGLNRLIIAAGLTPRQVVLVRTITRYLQQTELPFSPVHVQDQLAAEPELAAQLVSLFLRRLDPQRDIQDGPAIAEIEQAIDQALDAVASLDADRVLRAVYSVVTATLRTNYFQRDADGALKPYVSIKLDCRRVPDLPSPLPLYETFVYAPEVEGVHLRGGKVARGGLRWSDRREDFRTEVLGLMKAQMVKNAVIVPVGAKGGFVLKNAPADESREARQARGIAGYEVFIRGLLDITDNRSGDGIVAPADVVRYDGDDPYLVVAADKGTATFSDIANGLARDYGFWLDDAFASGGSAGYNHKAMGITARGAWEGVKRHFRELGRDTQREPFTVVGIGDMAGDVFGNGMLLSDQIQLVAAFNHRHIFIDPDPDPALGFAERRRLFEQPRSAWTDYDSSLLSAGGGIYERSAKIVELSEQACAALNIDTPRLTPNALIRAVLAAPVDLLWNGGIGTYVKARAESNAEVGDRANDAVRVDGRDLGCSVVGEGGNLGLTQAGRIEYALAGGRLNTDAIDNSGGVDSSDLEVNIKIALGTVEAGAALTRADRNALLHDMTDDVIALVLRTNYLQTQQISLLESEAVARFDEQVSFMRMLERDGWFYRQLERLPDDDAIEERLRNRQGLTRPELSVLISYSKIALADAVLASELPDDPYLDELLYDGFPAPLSQRFPDAVAGHRLRRELITALVTNQMVDRMGIATAHRLPAGFGARMDAAVRAYVLADEWLGGEALFGEVEVLDNQLPTPLQYELHKIVAALLKHAMSWLLTRPDIEGDIRTLVDRFRADARHLLADLPDFMVGAYLEHWQAERERWQSAGLDDSLAQSIASTDAGGGIMDMAALADECGRDVDKVARVYFALGDELGIPWLQDAIHRLNADGRWAALARSSLRSDSYRLHQQIVAQVLAAEVDDAKALAQWRGRHERTLAFIGARMAELQTIAQPGYEHLAVAVRDLVRLTSPRASSLGGAR